jgi:hypothetical protein
MSDLLEHHVFAGLLNTKFRVVVDSPDVVELELVEVSENKVTSHQEYFTIIFSGAPDQFLGQGTRSLQHDKMGTIDLFLVPVGKDESGIQYESVFNRILGQR